MKIERIIATEIPNFENRLFYAQLLSPYDCDSDSKYGYLAGAEECLESHKSINELEDYINQYQLKNNPLDEYQKAYMLAYKDYIIQEKKVITNEY